MKLDQLWEKMIYMRVDACADLFDTGQRGTPNTSDFATVGIASWEQAVNTNSGIGNFSKMVVVKYASIGFCLTIPKKYAGQGDREVWYWKTMPS